MADSSNSGLEVNETEEINEESTDTRPIAAETEAEPAGLEEEKGRLTQLPHTRVRHMMKLDPDLHIASQDSVFLVTKAAVCK